MTRTDNKYIESLARAARAGDSNAFAELYFATYREQYEFCWMYLKNESDALEALQKTYISVLRNLHMLNDCSIFISWLREMCFRTCWDMRSRSSEGGSIYSDRFSLEDEEYSVSQIMSLPSSEARAIILTYYDKRDVRETASLMGCSVSEVRHSIISGRKRLNTIMKR